MADLLFDTHCHLFASGFPDGASPLLAGPGAELREYARLREVHHIVRSLVIGYDEGPYTGNSDYVAGLATSRPWLIPLRYVRAGDALYGDIAAYPTTVAQARELADALRGARANGRGPRMLSLNVQPEFLAGMLPAIAELTGTWFLISHLGLPGPVADAVVARQRLTSVTQLAGLPNVSVKISGQYAASVQDYPHRDVQSQLDVLADELGMNMLVWGSDFAPCLADGAFDHAVDCLFPSQAQDTDREAIRHRNAQTMFEKFCGDAP